MVVGIVKWYDCRKGYGFILTPEGEDVLVHFTAIAGTGFRRLFDGEQVEYDATRGPKGLQATLVHRLNHVDNLREQKPKRRTPLNPPVSSNSIEPKAQDQCSRINDPTAPNPQT